MSGYGVGRKEGGREEERRVKMREGEGKREGGGRGAWRSGCE